MFLLGWGRTQLLNKYISDQEIGYIHQEKGCEVLTFSLKQFEVGLQRAKPQIIGKLP